MDKNVKLLDCTLRDGGYYTNWDFNDNVVEAYLDSVERLPIDYIEVGYRNLPTSGYMGQYAYCPTSTLKKIRSKYSKGLAIMLNEKSTTPTDAQHLLSPLTGIVDMVRLAVDPKNFDRAILLARSIKEMGFKVSLNTMYMSKWSMANYPSLSELAVVNEVADVFCMVDSFGGIQPNELRKTIEFVKKQVTIPLGFHGHNNLELSLANTLLALELGVEYVDATVLGMGRGAGNLKTELLLSALSQSGNLDIDFNELGKLVSAFTPLQNKYGWGTGLPYMISGAHSIPQKEVMEWCTNRIYSFNSIVRALTNRKNQVVDNAKYPLLNIEQKAEYAMIIGGGDSVREHLNAIKQFASKHNVALIFATSRHADLFKDLNVGKYYVLVGTEGERLKSKLNNLGENEYAILPPYPREMGTDVPDFCIPKTFELGSITFTNSYQDSCTAVALQTALNFENAKVLAVGYDGYIGNILSEKETTLTRENRELFLAFTKTARDPLCSLTPTIYDELEVKSIYQYIQ